MKEDKRRRVYGWVVEGLVCGGSKKLDSPCFTLRLEQRQNILLSHRALHVSDDRARGIIHELDTDLGDTTTRSSTAKDLDFG
jgi:hypothetical protein